LFELVLANLRKANMQTVLAVIKNDPDDSGLISASGGWKKYSDATS
jgi:hypothetical protein